MRGSEGNRDVKHAGVDASMKTGQDDAKSDLPALCLLFRPRRSASASAASAAGSSLGGSSDAPFAVQSDHSRQLFQPPLVENYP